MDTYFKADQSFECLELALSAHHTDRGYREEAVDPSFNLVAKVRAKRLRWLGHVLREGESHLVRRVLLGYIEDKANKYPEGSIMMDAPSHSSAQELIEIASDKADWNVSVNAIDWKPKAKRKRKVDTNASAEYVSQMKKDNSRQESK